MWSGSQKEGSMDNAQQGESAYEAPALVEVGDFAKLTLSYARWNGYDYADFRYGS